MSPLVRSPLDFETPLRPYEILALEFSILGFKEFVSPSAQSFASQIPFAMVVFFFLLSYIHFH
jgi:hypothetical protein